MDLFDVVEPQLSAMREADDLRLVLRQFDLAVVISVIACGERDHVTSRVHSPRASSDRLRCKFAKSLRLGSMRRD